MGRSEVVDAMLDAGLERPRVILVLAGGLFFDLCAGPNDRAGRRTERIAVTGTRNCKASKADVLGAIERLKA